MATDLPPPPDLPARGATPRPAEPAKQESDDRIDWIFRAHLREGRIHPLMGLVRQYRHRPTP